MASMASASLASNGLPAKKTNKMKSRHSNRTTMQSFKGTLAPEACNVTYPRSYNILRYATERFWFARSGRVCVPTKGALGIER